MRLFTRLANRISDGLGDFFKVGHFTFFDRRHFDEMPPELTLNHLRFVQGKRKYRKREILRQLVGSDPAEIDQLGSALDTSCNGGKIFIFINHPGTGRFDKFTGCIDFTRESAYKNLAHHALHGSPHLFPIFFVPLTGLFLGHFIWQEAIEILLTLKSGIDPHPGFLSFSPFLISKESIEDFSGAVTFLKEGKDLLLGALGNGKIFGRRNLDLYLNEKFIDQLMHHPFAEQVPLRDSRIRKSAAPLPEVLPRPFIDLGSVDWLKIDTRRDPLRLGLRDHFLGVHPGPGNRATQRTPKNPEIETKVARHHGISRKLNRHFLWTAHGFTMTKSPPPLQAPTAIPIINQKDIVVLK